MTARWMSAILAVVLCAACDDPPVLTATDAAPTGMGPVTLDGGQPRDAQPIQPDATATADATVSPDAVVAPDASPPGPTRAVLTGGNQRARSPGYRNRASVGAPQPVGRTRGNGKVLTVGPQSAP